MTKQPMETLKSITTWGGVAITLSGVMLNMARDGGNNIAGHAILLVGLAVTVCGHYVTSKLSTHQKADKALDQQQIIALKERLESVEKQTKFSTASSIMSLF